MKNTPKLLIVDDDEGDRTLMKKAIEDAGFDLDLYVANSGEEGLKKAEELKPGVIVVLDTSLPGMDGFETCKRIKAIDKNLKVIICTGLIDVVDAGKARAAGADDYCMKTSDFDALVASLRVVMMT